MELPTSRRMSKAFTVLRFTAGRQLRWESRPRQEARLLYTRRCSAKGVPRRCPDRSQKAIERIRQCSTILEHLHGRFMAAAVVHWRGVTGVSLAVLYSGNYIRARADEPLICLYTLP